MLSSAATRVAAKTAAVARNSNTKMTVNRAMGTAKSFVSLDVVWFGLVWFDFCVVDGDVVDPYCMLVAERIG